MKTTHWRAALAATLMIATALVVIPLRAQAAPDQGVLDALDMLTSATGMIRSAADIADLAPSLPFTDARPADLLRDLADRIPAADDLTDASSLQRQLEHADTTLDDGVVVRFGCPPGDDGCPTPVVVSLPSAPGGMLRLDLPIDVSRPGHGDDGTPSGDASLLIPAATDGGSNMLTSTTRDIDVSMHFGTTLRLRRQYGDMTAADGTWLEGSSAGRAPVIDLGADAVFDHVDIPLRLGIVDMDATVNGHSHFTAPVTLRDPNGDGRVTRAEWETLRPGDLFNTPGASPSGDAALDLDLTTPALDDGPTATLHAAGTMTDGTFTPTVTGSLGDLSRFDLLHADNLRDALSKLAAILRTAGSVAGHNVPFLGDDPTSGFSGNLADATGIVDRLVRALDAQSVVCNKDGGEPVPNGTPLPAGTILRCRAAIARATDAISSIDWRADGADVHGAVEGTVGQAPLHDVLVELTRPGVPDVHVAYRDAAGSHLAGLAAQSINEMQAALDTAHVPVDLRWDAAHTALVASLQTSAAHDVDTDVPLAVGDVLAGDGGGQHASGLVGLNADHAIAHVHLTAPQLSVGLGLVMAPPTGDLPAGSADRVMVVDPGTGLLNIGAATVTAPANPKLTGRVGFLGVDATLTNFRLGSPTGTNALHVALNQRTGTDWPEAWPLPALVDRPADALAATIALGATGDLAVGVHAGAHSTCPASTDGCVSALGAHVSFEWPDVLTGAPEISGDWSAFNPFRTYGSGDPKVMLGAILDQLDALAGYLDSSELRKPLPLVGVSPASLIGDISDARAKLAALRGAPGTTAPQTLQDLADAVTTALHLPAGAITLAIEDGVLKAEFKDALAPDAIDVPLSAAFGNRGADVFDLGGALVHLAPSGAVHFEADLPLDGTPPSLGDAGLEAGLDADITLPDHSHVGVGPFMLPIDSGQAALDLHIAADPAHGVQLLSDGGGVDCGTVTNHQTITALDGLACARLDLGALGQLGAVLRDDGHTVDASAPDFDFSHLTFDFTTLLQGFDALTGTLGSAMRTGHTLPVIGDALDGGSDAVGKLQATVQDLRDQLATLPPDMGTIESTIETKLPGSDATFYCGTGTCLSQQDTNLVDVTDLQVHFSPNKPIDVAKPFNLGLPGFPLSTSGTVRVLGGLDGDVTFGMSRDDGPYVSFPHGAPALHVGVNAGLGTAEAPCSTTAPVIKKLPGYDNTRCIRGRLGLLTAQLADGDGGVNSPKTSIGVDASLAVSGGALDAENRQRVPLRDFSTRTVDVTPTVTGGADLNLRFRTGIDGNDGLPSLAGRIDGHWSPTGTRAPTLSLDQLYIDPGNAIDKLAGPVINQLNDLVEPIVPVFDLLQAPLPVVSDLHLVDPPNLLGLLGSATDKGLIDSVTGIVAEARALTSHGTNTTLIPLGFNGQPGTLGIDTATAATHPPTQGNETSLIGASDIGVCSLTDATLVPGTAAPTCRRHHTGDVGFGQPPTPNPCPTSDDVPEKLGVTGLSFPVLDSPASLASLLVGKDATLVAYNPPCLHASFGAHPSTTIPVGFIPVTLSVGIDLNVAGHFGVSYDTAGLRSVVDGGNVSGLLRGFALDDLHGDPSDPAELHVDATLSGQAAVNAFVAKAGIEGGVGLGLDLNLQDPNHDGHVRFDELDSRGPLCWFDTQFSAFYFLRAFLEVHYLVGSHRSNLDIVPRTDVPLTDWKCGPAPDLATDQHNTNPHTLSLNTTSGDDHMTVRPIEGGLRVSRGGRVEDHPGLFDVVTGDGGEGNDILEFAPSADGHKEGMATDFHVVFTGGDGNDTLIGTDGADTLTGNKGDDHIVGGAGDDSITADSGTTGDSGNDVVDAGDGGDTVIAGPGDDTVQGGPGADLLLGNEGDDTLLGAADSTPTSTEVDTDTLVGGQGNDVLDGGPGDDHMTGASIGATGTSVVCGTIDPALSPDPSATVPDRDGDLEGIQTPDGKTPPRGDTGFELSGPPNDADQPAAQPPLLDPSDQFGNDSVRGGAGDDLLAGGPGDDNLVGGAGNDNVCGDGGVDHLAGDDPDDLTLVGDDIVEAGPGDDTVDAGPGFDDVGGGEGRDRIIGGDGGDVVFGDGGDVHRDDAGNTLAAVLAAGQASVNDVYGRMRSVGLPGHNDDAPHGVVPGNPSPSLPMSQCAGRVDPDAKTEAGGARCVGGGDGGPGFAQPGGPCSPFHDDPFADCIDGGDGKDYLFGGVGDDDLDGGDGGDVIAGMYDDDVVRGGKGEDTLNGDEGNDTLRGGEGKDTLDGGPSADSLFGEGGNDTLLGQGGLDTLDGGGGNDEYHGGGDEDVLLTSPGADLFHGDAGSDVVTYAAARAAVSVTADDQPDGATGNDGVSGEHDNVRSDVEQVVGSPFADHMDAASSTTTLSGGAGNDTLTASTVGSVLFGDDGDDTLTGRDNRDTLHGGAGKDTLDGGAGADTLLGEDGDDTILAGPAPDLAPINQGDVISGGAGTDTVDYSARWRAIDVTLDGSPNDGQLGYTELTQVCHINRFGVRVCVPRAVYVAPEGDNVAGDVEIVLGGSGNDTLTGNPSANTLKGNGGNDKLDGRAGPDTLDGGSGTDTCRRDTADRSVVRCERVVRT